MTWRKMRIWTACVPVAWLTLLLCACAAGGLPRPGPGNLTGHWGDAFAYCHAIGTIDQADARYRGPQPPPAVVTGLESVLGLRLDRKDRAAFARGIVSRCMGGEVYACDIGANLPCRSKADVSAIPTEAEKKYCEDNHDAYIIPMYVTGHNTIYEWRCAGSRPRAAATPAAVDDRGYIAHI